MRWRKVAMFAPMLFLLQLSAAAQGEDAEITTRVRMIEEGRADQVKQEMPALIAKHQNDPGILYLQGRLARNGIEAAKLYQSILDNYPKSEWADDALYRLHLYYYSLGLSRTAELKMQQLRKDYPNSPFIKEKFVPDTSRGEEHPPVVISPPAPQPRDTSALRPPPRDTSAPKPPRIVEPPPGAQPFLASYAIQVGAFSSGENATKLKSFFEELGYPVEVQNKVRAGRSLYLVWIGNFATADEARRFAGEIKAKHKVESIVVTR